MQALPTYATLRYPTPPDPTLPYPTRPYPTLPYLPACPPTYLATYWRNYLIIYLFASISARVSQPYRIKALFQCLFLSAPVRSTGGWLSSVSSASCSEHVCRTPGAVIASNFIMPLGLEVCVLCPMQQALYRLHIFGAVWAASASRCQRSL